MEVYSVLTFLFAANLTHLHKKLLFLFFPSKGGTLRAYREGVMARGSQQLCGLLCILWGSVCRCYWSPTLNYFHER